MNKFCPRISTDFHGLMVKISNRKIRGNPCNLWAIILFILFFIACKTVQPPEPIPEPEPAPVYRYYVIFNTIIDPATGYDWEVWIDYNSSGRFALNNIHKEDVYPGAIGSPQKQRVTLRSTQAGRVFVHFIYRRPHGGPFGGGGVQEIGRYIYTFDITKDLSIKLLDTERSLKQGYTEDSLPIIEEPEYETRR